MNDQPNKVLNPTVVRLGLVSFLADLSSEMLYPITPIFLTSVLGASMASVGLIEGVAEAIASLLKTYSGYWSDRTGKRKAFIVVGYFLAAIGKPLIGFAHTWQHVLFARGLDRTGKGLRGAPRDALLAEAIDPALRGEAFGWHRAMDTAGAALGPLLAILYLSYFKNELRPIFFWALIPGLFSVLLALSIREQKKNPNLAAKKPEFKLKDLTPSYKRYLLAWGVFSLANSSDVFLLMKVKSSGVDLRHLILMYCFYNLFYAALSPSLGKLSDHWDRKRVLGLGLGVFSAVYAGFALANQAWQFWCLFAIYGVYMAATDGVGKALAVDLIDPKFKATGVGVLGTVTGLATVVASTVAGTLWDKVSPMSAFLYGACGAIIATLILLTVDTTKRANAPA